MHLQHLSPARGRRRWQRHHPPDGGGEPRVPARPALRDQTLFGVGASTARRYGMALLLRAQLSPNFDWIKILLIDEKAVRKGHGYVTLVMKVENGELLYMAEG